MGTNCAPLVADLFLFCYERDFMMSLSDDKQADVIDAFNTCFFSFCCFTSQVNSYGHCGKVSSLNHTFSWAGLNKRLTSNLCTYFRL